MWNILKYTKSAVIPNDADYVFSDFKEFNKVYPYLYPKIRKKWKIVIFKPLLDTMISIEDLGIPDYFELVAYLQKEVYEKFIIKYPKYVNTKVSKKEQYATILKSIPKVMTSKAIKELYSRFHGNISKIEESIPELMKSSVGKDVIDVSCLDNVVMRDNTVYAKETLYTYLIWDSKLIGKRGNPLSMYRWKRPQKLLDTLIEEIGVKYSFYAIRKQVDYLVSQKIKYLHNKEYKEKIVEYIDVYQLSELYASFHLYGYGALRVLMNNIERRKKNDSLFKGDVITNY